MTNQPARTLRSRAWFDNPDNPDMTAIYLERYLNYGISREELQSGKPIIGIAQTGSDLSPCNRHHLELAKRVRDGIRDAGGIAIEFPVHPIQETGKRPTAGLDRNLAYLGLVETLYGYPIDGVVLTIGCDKTTPALLMAAATVNLPAIALSVGPMLNGWHRGERTGSGTIVWKAREMMAKGEIDYAGFLDLVASSAPSTGFCNTMGTATTMNSLGGRAVDGPAHERPAPDLARREQRLNLEADPPALHVPVANDRVGDLAREIGGNRARQAEADLVDADDLPLQVDERTAGVAAKDGGIVPDPAHDRPDVLAVERHAVERPEHARHDHLGVADDAHRDRLRQGERTAEGEHAVADLERGDVAEGGDGKFARRRRPQPEDSDVREGVGPYELGGDLFAVGERAGNRARASRDVMVGNHQPFRRDDRAAARGLALELPAVLKVDRDDMDPNEAGRDPGQGGLDFSALVRRWWRRLRGCHPGQHAHRHDYGERSAHGLDLILIARGAPPAGALLANSALASGGRGNLSVKPPAFRWRLGCRLAVGRARDGSVATSGPISRDNGRRGIAT
jgi:hypothetical protein